MADQKNESNKPEHQPSNPGQDTNKPASKLTTPTKPNPIVKAYRGFTGVYKKLAGLRRGATNKVSKKTRSTKAGKAAGNVYDQAAKLGKKHKFTDKDRSEGFKASENLSDEAMGLWALLIQALLEALESSSKKVKKKGKKFKKKYEDKIREKLGLKKGTNKEPPKKPSSEQKSESKNKPIEKGVKGPEQPEAGSAQKNPEMDQKTPEMDQKTPGMDQKTPGMDQKTPAQKSADYTQPGGFADNKNTNEAISKSVKASDNPDLQEEVNEHFEDESKTARRGYQQTDGEADHDDQNTGVDDKGHDQDNQSAQGSNKTEQRDNSYAGTDSQEENARSSTDDTTRGTDDTMGDDRQASQENPESNPTANNRLEKSSSDANEQRQEHQDMKESSSRQSAPQNKPSSGGGADVPIE